MVVPCSKLELLETPVSIDGDRCRPATHAIASGKLMFRILYQRKRKTQALADLGERFDVLATMKCGDKGYPLAAPMELLQTRKLGETRR